MKKKILTGSLLFASLLTLVACGSKSDDKKMTSEPKTEKMAKKSDEKSNLKDGTYKAESDFDERGWKVVHTITVTDGKITESNFGYENKDGKLKAGDEEYNKNMKAKTGTSSKEATEKLNKELVAKQNIDDVEVVSGATHTSTNFKTSTEALLKAASEGKTETITLDLAK
ncbi:FMN-binding protein [Streptococcus ictaluri]|uniref:FMN-binding domain protein n=1 Tax=Streptococcus ictaluri 707-05 TaxID=764299 RepID=G5K392_9STRE|nr:FMN-binding protein [Streptococcus ictaluri]EHI69377.1 FMN-binding domain protein [Streptococcus ictaluri 707-05]